VTDQALVLETESTTGASASLPHYLRDKQAVCKIVNTGGTNYQVYRLRQTLSSAEELAAAPEYVNADAYAALKGAAYAFTLPFDLDHTEAKAYFTRFDVSRAELMQAFQAAGTPADEAIAAETLGLTASERGLITAVKDNLVDQQSYWNAPAQWDTPPIAGNVPRLHDAGRSLPDKTGISYLDLELPAGAHVHRSDGQAVHQAPRSRLRHRAKADRRPRRGGARSRASFPAPEEEDRMEAGDRR
jgi:hypothetical protein